MLYLICIRTEENLTLPLITSRRNYNFVLLRPMFEEDLKQSLEVLKSGGIIIYPTDTVWGIGCDATNPGAIEKIYKLKNRPADKSMLILLDEDHKINRYIRNVPEVAWDLIELTEKPLTVIFTGTMGLPENLVADDDSIGIRIPKDEFCKQLIRKLNKPLVSTSANVSGEPTPGSFAEINKKLLDAADYVVKHRQKEASKATPSSIIKLGVNGEIRIIRR